MQLSSQRSTPFVLALLVATVTIAAFLHGYDLASRLAQNSDSAQSFVAGKAIVDGNLLLSGWRLSIDNFYFTDALPYAAFEWFLGPRPFLMVFVPALIYAVLVFTVLLACLPRSHPIMRNIEATAVVAFLFAAPVWIGDWDPLLLSAAHVATVLGALIALALCTWIATGENLRVPSLLGAGTTLVMVSAATLASDPLSLVFAFGPALAVLALEAANRPGNTRLALVLLLSGTALGLLLPATIACLGGGFAAVNYVSTSVTVSKIGSNLLSLLLGALTTLGANPLTNHSGIEDLVFLILHGIAFGLVVYATGFALFHMFGNRQIPLFDRLLCAGTVSLLAICTLSTQFGMEYTPQSMWDGGAAIRYVLPAVLISSLLASRLIPKKLNDARNHWARTLTRGALLFFAALAIFAGDWRGDAIETPSGWIENSRAAEAAQWLEKHRLYQGVGEYWSANLITALAGDRVRVRSVVPSRGRLRPYVWVADRRWYRLTPQFVIWQEPNHTGVVTAEVRATYFVCRTVMFATYHVAVLGTQVGDLTSRCS